MNIEKFLKNIDAILPSICTDKDLIEKIPIIFKNPTALFRLRQRNKAPPHIQTPNGRVVYLKEDVLSWIKGHYSSTKQPMDGIQGKIMGEEALCSLK